MSIFLIRALFMRQGVVEHGHLRLERVSNFIGQLCKKIRKAELKRSNMKKEDFSFKGLIGKEIEIDIGNRRRAAISIPASETKLEGQV